MPIVQNMYLSPINKGSSALFQGQFLRMANARPVLPTQLSVYGHTLHVPHAVAGRRMAKFSFKVTSLIYLYQHAN
jgi:predicted ATPase